MLECGFESCLGLEFLGFSMWHFRCQGCSPGTPASSHPSWVNGSANNIKLK